MMLVGWPLIFGKVKFAPPWIGKGQMSKSNILKMYERLMAETYYVWLK